MLFLNLSKYAKIKVARKNVSPAKQVRYVYVIISMYDQNMYLFDD